MAHLIGVSGKKRSGKDTLAAHLIDTHGYTRVAFADLIRELALTIDPIVAHTLAEGDEWVTQRLSDVVQTVGWEVAKANPEIRRTLQRLGIGSRDVLGYAVWLDAALMKVASIDGPVIITDVRMPNEAEAIEGAGGLLVRVNRPGQTSGDLHVTETALDDWPFPVTIDNDRTIADLHAAADELIPGGQK